MILIRTREYQSSSVAMQFVLTDPVSSRCMPCQCQATRLRGVPQQRKGLHTLYVQLQAYQIAVGVVALEVARKKFSIHPLLIRCHAGVEERHSSVQGHHIRYKQSAKIWRLLKANGVMTISITFPITEHLALLPLPMVPSQSLRMPCRHSKPR